MSKEKYDNSKFYKAQESWLRNKDDTSWQTMWNEVYNACVSTMKNFAKKVPGYIIEDLEGLALDTAVMIMSRYQKPKSLNIQNLSDYVYMPCFGVFYHPKKQFNDRLKRLKYEDSTEESYSESYDTFEDDLIERLSREGY